MQTLKFQIPEGYEVDSFDKLACEIKLKQKPKKVTDRIKSLTDVLADNGLTQEEFNESCGSLEPDEVSYRILKLLTKSLNEGWVPDWSNSNEAKYYAWFEMRGSSGFRFNACGYWGSISLVGSRLCFKSKELAEHAGRHFQSVYEQFMTIN